MIILKKVLKTILLIVSPLLVAFLFEKYFPNLFNRFVQIFVSFFTIKIDFPVWVFFFLTVLLLAICITLVILYFKKIKKPLFTNYTKDVFEGVVWEWRYYNSAPYELNESSISAFCLNDETPLVLRKTPYSHNYTHQFICETCDFISTEFAEEGESLRKKIIRRIIGQIRISSKE